MEIVTQKMSSTKLKSPLQTRKKRTSDFVTLLLNYDTETICVHSVMSGTNTLPNLVSTYAKVHRLKDQRIAYDINPLVPKGSPFDE